MNHSRCCANDNSNPSLLLTAFITGASACLPLLRSSSIASASPATVGLSNITLSPTSTPITSLTLDITCVASSECPPSSKKFSLIPASSILNTSLHIPPTISSTAVLATSSRSSLPFITAGSGSLFLSTFPFAVNGISSTSTITQGTMYSGSLSLRYSLSSLSSIFFSLH